MPLIPALWETQASESSEFDTSLGEKDKTLSKKKKVKSVLLAFPESSLWLLLPSLSVRFMNQIPGLTFLGLVLFRDSYLQGSLRSTIVVTSFPLSVILLMQTLSCGPYQVLGAFK